MWPYIWIAFMLGLVITTTVVAYREKKARAAAVKKFAPQPLSDMPEATADAGDDGFGAADPLDDYDPNAEVASLDEDAFK